MKRLRILVVLCALCFFIGGGLIISLLIQLWEDHTIKIVIALALIGIGWFLRDRVNALDWELKNKQEKENAEYREQFYEQHKKGD